MSNTTTTTDEETGETVTTKSGSYDFYLDAIRIYDPTGNENDVANEAYVADGEGWPVYEELRNNVINASEYDITTTTDGEGNVTVEIHDVGFVEGAIFIDSEDANLTVANYVSYGPNNELYLATNQAVAFKVSVNDYIADVQLGIKVANGNTVTFEINGDSYTVNSATDLYYSIKDYCMDSEGESNTVIIQNTSGGILSLTNIKVTYTQDPTSLVSESSLLWMDEASATAAVMSLRRSTVETESAEETTETEESETEETTEAEESETEETTEAEEFETEGTTEVEESETEGTTEVEESETEETTEVEETEEDTNSSSGNIFSTIINAINTLLNKWFG